SPDKEDRVHIATVQSLVRRILYPADDDERPTPGLYDCIIVDEAHRGYVLDAELREEDLSFRTPAGPTPFGIVQLLPPSPSGRPSYDRLAPEGDRPFNEPGLGVVLGEELGLAVDQLGAKSPERFGDLRMQLLTGIAQQAAVRCVVHQRVLKGINRVGRTSALEHQFGSDKASNGRCSSSSGRGATARSSQ